CRRCIWLGRPARISIRRETPFLNRFSFRVCRFAFRSSRIAVTRDRPTSNQKRETRNAKRETNAWAQERTGSRLRHSYGGGGSNRRRHFSDTGRYDEVARVAAAGVDCMDGDG